jgi:hypothetical protein
MARPHCIILTAFLLASPAAAQDKTPINENQCAEQFKKADVDNDGVLSAAEIGTFKQSLPASLANKDRVSRADFMALCGKRAS